MSLPYGKIVVVIYNIGIISNKLYISLIIEDYRIVVFELKSILAIGTKSSVKRPTKIIYPKKLLAEVWKLDYIIINKVV